MGHGLDFDRDDLFPHVRPPRLLANTAPLLHHPLLHHTQGSRAAHDQIQVCTVLMGQANIPGYDKGTSRRKGAKESHDEG